MSIAKNRVLRGDTLIEVMFSIGIFALVSISVSTLMNSMLGKAQSSIEVVMARSEIDAQAEAIRFIRSAYKDDKMKAIWDTIKDKAIDQHIFDESVFPFTDNPTSCDVFNSNDFKKYAFYIDTFNLNNTNPNNIIKTNTTTADIFPRVIHTSTDEISGHFDDTGEVEAQGIWVLAIKNSGYYDFYIQTCWSSLGSPMPSTINTVFRLNKPEGEA